MSFIVQANSGNTVNIQAEQDGGINNILAAGHDFICGGIGDEFEITTSGSSLQVTVGSGEALINGRSVRTDNTNTITLTASSVTYLVLRIDLTQAVGNEGLLYGLSSLSNLQTDNLNSGGSKHDLLLATITSNASGVVSVVDNRDIRTSVFLSGTVLPATAQEGDIFFLYEE